MLLVHRRLGPSRITRKQLASSIVHSALLTFTRFVLFPALALFQDSYYSGDLEDSTSTSWGINYTYLRESNRTFVPMRWMCKKQTSVSQSSTESEVISSDAGLRMDGIPALDLWDLVHEVLHSSFTQPRAPGQLVSRYTI